MNSDKENKKTGCKKLNITDILNSQDQESGPLTPPHSNTKLPSLSSTLSFIENLPQLDHRTPSPNIDNRKSPFESNANSYSLNKMAHNDWNVQSQSADYGSGMPNNQGFIDLRHIGQTTGGYLRRPLAPSPLHQCHPRHHNDPLHIRTTHLNDIRYSPYGNQSSRASEDKVQYSEGGPTSEIKAVLTVEQLNMLLAANKKTEGSMGSQSPSPMALNDINRRLSPEFSNKKPRYSKSRKGYIQYCSKCGYPKSEQNGHRLDLCHPFEDCFKECHPEYIKERVRKKLKYRKFESSME